MGNTVNLTLKINVVNGPSLSVSETANIEAYDKIDVTVEAEASDKAVEIQPGASGQIHMLLIRSNKYSDALTFKVHETGATPVSLDQPQLYLGKGAVGLLGAQVDKLFFSNATTEDANIEIFVCRDATP